MNTKSTTNHNELLNKLLNENQNLNNKLNNLEKQINAPKVPTVQRNIVSIAKGLLFFYLIISGNYLGELLSCRIERLFADNMPTKHIIALISLYFFVIISDSRLSKINPIITVGLTLVLYVWFIISAKSESHFFILSLTILVLIAFMQIYHEYLEKRKDKLNNVEQQIYKYINSIQIACLIIIVIITIIGFLTYLGMKKTEYKHNWSWRLFLLGRSKCKDNFLGDTSDVDSMIKHIKKKQDLDSISSIIYFIKRAF